MFALARRTQQPRRDYASCSGCGLCLPVCPVWRVHHDIGLTPLGRAKALQHGAGAADIAASIQGCTLCAACEPVCPEEIALVAMTLGLRRELLQSAFADDLRTRMEEQTARPLAAHSSTAATLLPGQALRERPATLARAAALLGGAANISLADDDGADIALALETGAPIPAQRLERFLQPLRGMKRIIVADGLLLRHLRQWQPRTDLASLGLTLSNLPVIRRVLRAEDLYVIEPRAYHDDYQRLVKHYDALRSDTGCTLNLDLQRIAIPATARSLAQARGPHTATEAADCAAGDSVQVRWILQGRRVTRIVVESAEDVAAFERVGDLPVVHLADLVDDGTS